MKIEFTLTIDPSEKDKRRELLHMLDIALATNGIRVPSGDLHFVITTGSKYLACPDCGKKGVRLTLRPRGEDGYWCRYCASFDCYTGGDSAIDARNRERLAAANPGREVAGLFAEHVQKDDKQ